MLRYGVLGLLIERRGYGYELVQRLSARLGSAWQLNPSAVYTALDQLEGEGLISTVETPPAICERRSSKRGQGRRVVYCATELGLHEYRAWMSRPSDRIDPIRSELALKVALACPDSVPSLLASVAHKERLIMRSLDDKCTTTEHPEAQSVKATPHPNPSRVLADPITSGSWPSAASALVSAAAATQLQGELAWLQSVRETLEKMLRDSLSAAAGSAFTGTVTMG